MAIKKQYATINGKCYERIMVIPPGENDWIAHPTRGDFKPCGSYPRVANDIQEPKVFAAREPRKGIINSPLFLVSDRPEAEPERFPTESKVFDATEDSRAGTFVNNGAVMDAFGDLVEDEKSEKSETNKRKTLYWVAAIVILLVVFRKRLGFG